MKIKFKKIHEQGELFLCRLSIQFNQRSLKFHLILNDDSRFHSHPWDFKSLILFGGYQELIEDVEDEAYHWEYYNFLDVNKKAAEVRHLIRLNRLWGFKVPTLTVGLYGEKKRLCSLYEALGYCQTNAKAAVAH